MCLAGLNKEDWQAAPPLSFLYAATAFARFAPDPYWPANQPVPQVPAAIRLYVQPARCRFDLRKAFAFLLFPTSNCYSPFKYYTMKKIALMLNTCPISRTALKNISGGAKTRYLCSNNICGVCAASLSECQTLCPGGTCSASPVCAYCPIQLD